ncbi:thiol protease SEN102-like [Oryza brachyantha]|nr:thiol protease SEN102-like [Oryza brachyantha]
MRPIVKISGIYRVPYGDEETLKQAVYFYGPVAVAIEASKDFVHYREIKMLMLLSFEDLTSRWHVYVIEQSYSSATGKIEMMKPLVAVLVIAVAAMAVADDVPFTDKDLESEESIWKLYERWGHVHGLTSRDLAEKGSRFEAFKVNAKHVNEFNKKEGMTYELGLNKFADMTLEEFLAKYAGAKVDAVILQASVRELEEEVIGDVPTTWDWRQHGAVTAVKDQGQCGSCWAFSAVGAVESANAIATGNLLKLSEQQVLDCSGDGDCNGGWPDMVLKGYAIEQGIALDSSGNPPYYPPYVAAKMSCRTVAGKPVVKMDGTTRVASGETALKQSVSLQPVSVLIEADTNFQLYKSGVYSGPCGTKVNHAVLAVGYGVTSNNINYWIVKNSWNTTWGESGYIRMKRDVGGNKGLCGIAMYGIYPTKIKQNPFSSVAASVADAAFY